MQTGGNGFMQKRIGVIEGDSPKTIQIQGYFKDRP
jgi:hypothetical protein